MKPDQLKLTGFAIFEQMNIFKKQTKPN